VQQRPVHRPDIDGLRAVAILAVLAFATSAQWLRGGHLGIDVFLVVSGYLLSSTILSNLDNGTFDLLDFYRRRIRRILPALLLMLLAVFAVGWFFLFAREYRRLGKEIAAGSTLVTNLLSWSGRNGNGSGMLGHLWSLAILAQFCVVWPVLLKKIADPRIIGALLLLSFGLSFYCSYYHPLTALYSPLTRAWEPMVGWALVQMHRQGWRWDRPAANTASAFGCLLLAVGFAVVDDGHAFPGWRALLPVLGAGLVLSAGPDAWVNRRILSNWILVGLGLVSYPLYLWYWPALSFARLFESETPPSAVRIAVLAVVLLLAVGTHALIERPTRRRRDRFDSVALLALAMVTGALGSICFVASGFPGTGFRDPARQAFLESFEGTLPVGCTEHCTARDPGRRHAVLLWGDVQARALYASLTQNLPADWQVLQVAQPGCLPQIYSDETGTADACERFNRAAIATIAAARPEVVIVVHDRAQLVRRFVPVAARLHELGVTRTLLVGPAPHWGSGLPTVVARQFWRDTPRRTFTGVDPQIQGLNEGLNRTFIPNDTMAFVDIIGLFCDTDGCLIYLGDDRRTGLTSMDDGHLRPIAADHLVRHRLARMITGSVKN
jgi:peptidoglycan/LPS O-acetylase OafA/YrhL